MTSGTIIERTAGRGVCLGLFFVALTMERRLDILEKVKKMY